MLEFDEKKHEYRLDGKKLISVTQLMQKHGLAPSYAGVSSEVLNAKAERGTLIHQEIEDYNKNGKIGFTDEMIQFKEYVEANKIIVKDSELMLHNDIVAGTCDLILLKNQEPIIADIKTTYTLHQEAVSWQLSIYLYLYFQDFFKGHYSSPYEEWKGQAFHFNKDGELNVVDILLKPYEEVEKLMECERNGELYKQEISELNVNLTEVKRLEQLIKYCDEQKKKAEEQAKAIKEALLTEMESRGLKSFEKDGLKITYVAPSTRSTLDSKAIKEKYPAIYDAHLKETEIKASLKITLKGEK